MSDTRHAWRNAVAYWPLGWPTYWSRLRRAVIGAVGIAFAVVLLSFPLALAHQKISLPALYGVLSFGGLAAVMVGIASWDRRDVRAWTTPRTRSAHVTAVSTTRQIWLVRTATLIVLAAAAFLAPSLLGPIEGGSERLRARVEFLLPTLPAVGVLVVGYVVLLLLAKSKFLGIAISSEGVYHSSWGGCSFYSWEDIRRVEPGVKAGPGVQLWLPSKFEPPGNAEESLLGRTNWFRRKKNSWLPLGTLAVHPVVVYEALWFYHKHPELRHELGTEAGLERARTANFPDVIEELAKTGEPAPKSRHSGPRK